MNLPLDYPRLKDNSIAIPSGSEVFVNIRPEITIPDDSIKGFDIVWISWWEKYHQLKVKIIKIELTDYSRRRLWCYRTNGNATLVMSTSWSTTPITRPLTVLMNVLQIGLYLNASAFSITCHVSTTFSNQSIAKKLGWSCVNGISTAFYATLVCSFWTKIQKS